MLITSVLFCHDFNTFLSFLFLFSGWQMQKKNKWTSYWQKMAKKKNRSWAEFVPLAQHLPWHDAAVIGRGLDNHHCTRRPWDRWFSSYAEVCGEAPPQYLLMFFQFYRTCGLAFNLTPNPYFALHHSPSKEKGQGYSFERYLQEVFQLVATRNRELWSSQCLGY